MLITTHTADTLVASVQAVAPRPVAPSVTTVLSTRPCVTIPANADMAICTGTNRGSHAVRYATSWLFEQKEFGTKYHSQRERPT